MFTCLCLAASALPGHAALAPQYQRLAELRAILASDAVMGRLSGAPVDRVEYVSPDLYRVTAGACTLEVKIVSVPEPEPMPGPRKFTVAPGLYACR
ncbi:hypothetical protein KL771_02160 [Hyphomicrobiaceae bacterium 22]|uniref:Uncharacterized protein n=1 Tax=Prosthecodimorpha staleyi TaxID=2840188 RepID=A0A947D006_9HYPH|nr:hypothetical protein [Prosthecodimorpha staleyi]